MSKISNDKPHTIFKNYYDLALNNNQKSIEAVAISSLNSNINEVDSRMVNLKYIIKNEWIFFSNFNSFKAKNFEQHNQISALFFWDSINIQIRIKAKVYKTSSEFSDIHYQGRSFKKNALAHSSNQSKKVDSYESVLRNYKKLLTDKKKLLNRPEYWGGFLFKPYYFEFWEGNDSRVNKRYVYNLKDDCWDHYLLEP
jgi:pyridoxamine 5'-phosphate oxidase